MYATKSNDIAICILCLVSQPQRIADKVSQILDISGLVAMSQNDRVTFFFEA